MQPRWEHFEHEADVGLRATGEDRAAVFAGLAVALTAAITDPRSVQPQRAVGIRCAAPAQDLLLVDWLNALIYEMATRRMLFSSFEVTLEGDGLRARAWGETIDRDRHHPAVEVKGATYTALRLEQLPDGGWLGECVVDV